mmetsp:Transcript_8926/g.21903  ORF Transcript_8926/g.21903 Transcript_8926/m.21903 type:complete len:203 (-) Transcript_8926:3582-4190(-)
MRCQRCKRVPLCSVTRVLDREVSGGAKKQRRLTHSFAGVNRGRLGWCVREEAHAKIAGNVEGCRDLVGTWAFGKQVPVVVEDHLLYREQTQALDKCTFDLSDINDGIQGVADIMQDVSTDDLVIASQRIHFNFSARDTVSKIIKGLACVLHPIPRDVWSCVEPIGGQIDPVKVCQGRSFCQRADSLFVSRWLRGSASTQIRP